MNPLGGISAYTSEPLDTASALTLSGTSRVALHALAEAPPAPLAVIRFGTSQILPFGGTWQLAGVARDLAGNPLRLDGSFRLGTAADPGVQAQDGFEAPLSGVSGSAQLVAGRGSVSALSGAQSLWLEPNSPLTIHLQRSTGQKDLHFVGRAFSYQKKDVYNERIVKAGVVGGTQILTLTRTAPVGDPVSASGDEQLAWVSGVMKFDAVLGDPGTDVVLEISDEFCVESPTCQQSPAWLIDDLALD